MNPEQPPVIGELFSVMNGSTASSATFVFGNEDHTLGNCLRHILMQREETDFCGYSVPHPYEPTMNVRLQTNDKGSAIETLYAGLKDLEECTNVLDQAFISALIAYENKISTSMKEVKKEAGSKGKGKKG